MTSLRVILDGVGGGEPTPIGQYGLELTRALTTTAPRGTDVLAFAAGADTASRTRITEALPGVSGVEFARMPRRELREAWLHSFTTASFEGLVHATGLLAPTRLDDDDHGRQVVATVHGLSPLNGDSRSARWFRRALRRAARHADAIVVPTHSVAARLHELHDLGDRIRVIAGGVPTDSHLPVDADARADRLGLPERYLLATTERGGRALAEQLVAIVGSGATPEMPIVVVGPVAWGEQTLAQLAVSAGLPPSRMLMLGELDIPDRAVAIGHAEAMLVLGTDLGFALPLLEAFALGTAVVHEHDESTAEISDDAGLAVRTVGDGSDADRFAHALAQLIEHDDLRQRHGLLGRDRARAFDWTTTASAIWQLHADL